MYICSRYVQLSVKMFCFAEILYVVNQLNIALSILCYAEPMTMYTPVNSNKIKGRQSKILKIVVSLGPR